MRVPSPLSCLAPPEILSFFLSSFFFFQVTSTSRWEDHFFSSSFTVIPRQRWPTESIGHHHSDFPSQNGEWIDMEYLLITGWESPCSRCSWQRRPIRRPIVRYNLRRWRRRSRCRSRGREGDRRHPESYLFLFYVQSNSFQFLTIITMRLIMSIYLQSRRGHASYGREPEGSTGPNHRWRPKGRRRRRRCHQRGPNRLPKRQTGWNCHSIVQIIIMKKFVQQLGKKIEESENDLLPEESADAAAFALQSGRVLRVFERFQVTVLFDGLSLNGGSFPIGENLLGDGHQRRFADLFGVAAQRCAASGSDHHHNNCEYCCTASHFILFNEYRVIDFLFFPFEMIKWI